MTFDRELECALSAAALASRVILEQYAERTAIADAPVTISTSADLAAQDAIIGELVRAFPDDAFRAEESTALLKSCRRDGPRLWIIDPIDGTRGFAKKNDQFSVMIALVVDGVPVVGVVEEPALRRITYAQRDAGCWRRDGESAPVQVNVSATTDLEALTLTQSHTKPGRPPTVAVTRLKPKRVIETYSAGIKLAQVARGEADLYVCEYDAMNDWDIAAGYVLVAEAGGRVTTADGRDLIFGRPDPLQRGGLVTTNGAIHDSIVAVLDRASDS